MDWLDRLLVANLVLQMVIIVTGGLVRLTGSGLGCPTWPQCVPGSFTPTVQQEQGYHKLIEFGNRLLTFVLAAVALAVIIVAAQRPGHLAAAVPVDLGAPARHRRAGHRRRDRRAGQARPADGVAALPPRIALVGVSAWLLYRYREGTGRSP